MKTLAISLVLVLAAAMSHAQGLIELNETRVDYSPLFSEITQQGNMYIMKVRENRSGEFEKDPLTFLNKNFNVQQFIALVNDQDYDSYQVSFKSNKGDLRADYDKEGNLEYVSHRFKNIAMPYPLMQKLYKENEGWSVVKNVHVAYGKDGKIDRSFYKVTLKNGKQERRLKIDAPQADRIAAVER
ncbi:MAG TPA: hypothetical protein VK941_07335 [Gillisia sp.]|nr:hypothetical protein [Gillisia sp.]